MRCWKFEIKLTSIVAAVGVIAINKKNNNRTLIWLAAPVAGALLLAACGPSAKSSQDLREPPVIERYEAIGDSITYGQELAFKIDRNGYPRKSPTTFQGWPALLGQLLADRTGARTEVFNKGYPGERVGEFRLDRFPGLFDIQSRSSRALLLIGTNDSNDFRPTPSGRGCSGRSCKGTFNGNMRTVIERLQSAGRETLHIGLLPPAWGSDLRKPYEDPLDLATATRNARIVEYNRVIVEELLQLPGVRPGPDFFSCFLSPNTNRFSLFDDALHPNKLGYALMAALWRDAITAPPQMPPVDSCPSPIYILEDLDAYRHGHKQNLLEAGDRYYADESHTLVNIPVELSEGIWVVQANANRGNSDPDYLQFNVGDFPVSIYIAYDAAGNPPVSTSHEFAATQLSSDLLVSDSSVGAFAVVRASGVSGPVSIGGTLSAGAAGTPQAYVVIVVPKSPI